MTVLTPVTGLGWGWIANLGTPGTVRSWMAPATGVGLLISGALHVVGVGVGLGGVLTVTRFLGLLGRGRRGHLLRAQPQPAPGRAERASASPC